MGKGCTNDYENSLNMQLKVYIFQQLNIIKPGYKAINYD